MRDAPAVIRVEGEREEDGRWLAEVPALSGVLAYGRTRDEAVARVETLALRILGERLEHGEPTGQVSEPD
jgi:predicted RNase H-like HicB family nuclease